MIDGTLSTLTTIPEWHAASRIAELERELAGERARRGRADGMLLEVVESPANRNDLGEKIPGVDVSDYLLERIRAYLDGKP